MPLIVNGVTIPDGGEIYVNGVKPVAINVNGTEVWKDFNPEYLLGIAYDDNGTFQTYGFNTGVPMGSLSPSIVEGNEVNYFVADQNNDAVLSLGTDLQLPFTYMDITIYELALTFRLSQTEWFPTLFYYKINDQVLHDYLLNKNGTIIPMNIVAVT